MSNCLRHLRRKRYGRVSRVDGLTRRGRRIAAAWHKIRLGLAGL